MLAASAELQLLRAAVRQNSDGVALRLRLARLLNTLDMFSENIELLNENNAINATLPARLLLISAYFARNADGDNARAKAEAENAYALVQTDADRSYVLAEHAKAHLRLGDDEAAFPLLWRALELAPNNVNAFKRLSFELMHRQKPEEVLGLIDRLRQQGAGHSRLLAAQMMALSASGDSQAAQQLLGESHFVHQRILEVPSGWADLAAFNTALTKEINSNPGMRFERYGTSSQKAWRVDHPATSDTPAVSALLLQIAKVAAAHAVSCAEHAHIWSSDCPQTAVLRSWCVITEGDGYENWHMHPEGWMSGGYYVEVPDAVAGGVDDAGCLAFGMPGGLIGDDAAQNFAQIQIRPLPGMLTLFPSHAYHRTFPHNAQGRRMCIAFDICPF